MDSILSNNKRTINKSKRETKSRGFYMRMTESELQELDYLSYECEESKTEIMRKALKVYRDLKRNNVSSF